MNSGHIDSYYARTLAPGADWPALAGRVETDVCVVGGGLAGLSAALSLAERGRKVALVEARRVGWGASGRNGGFVSPGFAAGLEGLVKRAGLERTRELYALTRDAVRLVRSRIDGYRIAADPVDSGMLLTWWRDEPGEAQRFRDWAQETYGIEHEYWPRERVREVCVTTRYHDGLFRNEGFHFHPLNYARGVAAAIVAQNGQVFEQSPAVAVEYEGAVKRVRIAGGGEIAAKTIVIACGGYIGNLVPQLARAVKPIATYVIVTEPLGNRLGNVLRGKYAIHDSRFDFDYYRPLSDTRILWGHGISVFSENLPIAEKLRRHMLAVYPQLADVKVETAWGGTMSYPTHKMPQVGLLAPGAWYAQGYGGHGMATTALTGELIASAIHEGDRRYELLSPFGLTWTGGPTGTAYAQAVYWYYRFLDWIRG